MKNSRFTFFRNCFVVVFAVSLLLLVAGCGPSVREGNTEESLRNAAERYWKLRMEDNYKETYGMEKPEGLPPFEEYSVKAKQIKKFNIISHIVKGVRVEQDKGVTDVVISFIVPPVSKPFSQVIQDQWVYEDGTWLHVFSMK
ncbi:MAG: hypothetical protein AB1442_02895 [Nitrospirota bacterium]